LDGKLATKKNEYQEIRDVAKIIFYGGSPDCDLTIEDCYKKWKYFFDLFLSIINPKNGFFQHLPTNNSPHEQPYKTMQVLSVMREIWIEKINDDYKTGK
jgi:hypothetical protein